MENLKTKNIYTLQFFFLTIKYSNKFCCSSERSRVNGFEWSIYRNYQQKKIHIKMPEINEKTNAPYDSTA